MTTANKIFSLFSFMGFVFCCIPFRRYMLAWNTRTCLNMAWTGLACLVHFINSIIWNDNLNDSIPVWCDISTRLDLAFVIAIPVAVLCITRRIYLMTIGSVPSTSAEKNRAVIMDIALGFGIPMIMVTLMYIPQNSRFLIFEDFGCAPSISNTFVAIALGCVPQVLVSFACAFYSTLAIHVLYKKYSEINELLASNNTIDKGLYLRVLFIAVFGSICLVPLGLYSLISSSITAGPWPGWKNTHTDISEIILIPVSLWRSDQVSEYQLEIQRWQFVFNAFVIFACFGIHKEARTRYLSNVQWLFHCVPCFRVNKRSANQGIDPAPGGMPPLIFAHAPTTRRLKFLDFSPNKTRVVADIGGGLAVTEDSVPSMTTYGGVGGDYGASREAPILTKV